MLTLLSQRSRLLIVCLWILQIPNFESQAAEAIGAGKAYVFTCVFRTGSTNWAWYDGLAFDFVNYWGQPYQSQIGKTYAFAPTPFYRCDGVVAGATALGQTNIAISNIAVCTNFLNNANSTFINASCPREGYRPISTEKRPKVRKLSEKSIESKQTGTFVALDAAARKITISKQTGKKEQTPVSVKQIEALGRLEPGMPMLLIRHKAALDRFDTQCYRIGNSACGGSANAPCPSSNLKRIYYKCVADDGSATYYDDCEADGCAMTEHLP